MFSRPTCNCDTRRNVTAISPNRSLCSAAWFERAQLLRDPGRVGAGDDQDELVPAPPRRHRDSAERVEQVRQPAQGLVTGRPVLAVQPVQVAQVVQIYKGDDPRT